MSRSIFVVTGGRHFSDKTLVSFALDAAAQRANGCDLLVHGGAKGADALAVAWAEARGIPTQVFQAAWNTQGPSAGPIRNQTMVNFAAEQFDQGADVLLVAFPGGAGTNDCFRKARTAGLRTVRYHASVTGSVTEVHKPQTRKRASVAA